MAEIQETVSKKISILSFNNVIIFSLIIMLLFETAFLYTHKNGLLADEQNQNLDYMCKSNPIAYYEATANKNCWCSDKIVKTTGGNFPLNLLTP